MSWQKFEISVSPRRVPMGQAMVPEVFGCHLSDFDDGSPEVDIYWQMVNGAPVCREVRIRSVDSDREVQCSGLAGVRVEDLLEQTVKALVWNADLRKTEDPDRWAWPSGAVQRGAVGEVRQARSRRKMQVTDELLSEVAEVYRANVERQPTAAVADHFDRAHRTAALYVKRAREAGHLGAAIKGKAGER